VINKKYQTTNVKYWNLTFYSYACLCRPLWCAMSDAIGPGSVSLAIANTPLFW
jgi:hypothetical protein